MQFNNSRSQLGWFHRYPARFSIEILNEMMERIFDKLGFLPNSILDPFAGTGSSLSFAKQLGIPSYGIELTQLGVLICNVRLNQPRDLKIALETAETLALDVKPGDAENVASELRAWIGDKNAAQLDYLLKRIKRVEGKRLRNWLMLAVSSSLRPSSRWLPGSIKPQIDRGRKYSDLMFHFCRLSRMLKNDCEREGQLHVKNCLAEVYQSDSRLIGFGDESIESVITSPPYFTMYDYFDVHRLSYLAFNWDKPTHRQIGRKWKISKDGKGFIPPYYMKKWYQIYFNKEDSGKGRALREYFQGMEMHIQEIHWILKSGGVAAYAVANSFKNGKKFSLVQALADVFKRNGFQDVSIRSRKQSTQRILPAGRNFLTGKFDSKSKPAIKEYIILSQKN